MMMIIMFEFMFCLVNMWWGFIKLLRVEVCNITLLLGYDLGNGIYVPILLFDDPVKVYSLFRHRRVTFVVFKFFCYLKNLLFKTEVLLWTFWAIIPLKTCFYLINLQCYRSFQSKKKITLLNRLLILFTLPFMTRINLLTHVLC